MRHQRTTKDDDNTLTMTLSSSTTDEASVDQLTGLCRPRQRETPAPQGIHRQHRHDPKVGIMHPAALMPGALAAGFERLTGLAR
jgi:hypothetical protein